MGTPEIEALKSTLTINSARAGWCTVAVFVGLIVEYTILLWLKRKEFSRTELVLTIVAGIAIAGGVWGEYVYGSRASDAAIKLENISEASVADAQAKLEGERRTRLELEKSLAPRVLFIVRNQDHTSNIDDLKEFSGTTVSLEYIPDFEAERAARILASVLDQSGWKVSGVKSSTEYMFEGIAVGRYNHPDRGDLSKTDPDRRVTMADFTDVTHSQHACDAVTEFLLDNSWSAMGRATLPGDIPPRSVRIRVGFKPAQYFLPEPLKHIDDQTRAMLRMVRPKRDTTSKTPISILEVAPWPNK